MYKKIFLILILLVTMVFSVSAEILDYDTFNRADNTSIGVTEGQGEEYFIGSESTVSDLSDVSIQNNEMVISLTDSSSTELLYLTVNISLSNDLTYYIKSRTNSEPQIFSSVLFGVEDGQYGFMIRNLENVFNWQSFLLSNISHYDFFSFDSYDTVETLVHVNQATNFNEIWMTDGSTTEYFNKSLTINDIESIVFLVANMSGGDTTVYIDEWAICSGRDLNCRPFTNTEPVINSISPSTRVELKQGETQLYTADVTDTEGDATYSWEVGGIEVSTSETYTADWDDIEAGIYTLRLTVSDTEYSDTTTQTLEIRAVGGSPSSGSSGGSTITTTTTSTEEDSETTKIQPKQQNIFQKIWDWFKNLFRRG